MALFIYDGFLLRGETRDAWLPRIGYQSILPTGTITASSAQFGHSADLVADPFTDTAWIGEEGEGEWWLQVSGGEADYAGLMAWDLFGANVRLQASNDGAEWFDVAGPVMTPDRVLVFLFERQTHAHWRWLFQGATENPRPPQIANASLGVALVLDHGFPIGFEPPRQARNNTISNNTTEQGHFVGRSRIRRGIETTLSLGQVADSWVREAWEPFIDHAETRPFYLLWSPLQWPTEAAFVWSHGRYRKPRYSSPRHMDVSLSVQGFAR